MQVSTEEVAAAKETDPLDAYVIVEKDDVMVFKPRVEEAQRIAKTEIKALMEDRGKKGSVLKGGKGRKRGPPGSNRDHMDAEEG